MKNNPFARLLEAAVIDAPPPAAAPAAPAAPASPAAPAAAAQPTGTVLDGAKPSTDGEWLKTLPTELQADPSLANFKTVADLAKSWKNVQPMIGAEKMPAPTAKWGEAEWNAHWNRLGRPETSDKYTDPKDVKLPEGVTIDPVALKSFRDAAHKAGLNGKQYEAAVAFYMNDMGGRYTQQLQSIQQMRVNTETALKTKWGDSYEANLTMANQALAQLGGDKVSAAVRASGIANNADFIEFMHKLATVMSEDSATGGGPRVVLQGDAQAMAQINAKKSDGEFIASLFNRQHPAHKANKEEWNRLHKVAYPDKPAPVN